MGSSAIKRTRLATLIAVSAQAVAIMAASSISSPSGLAPPPLLSHLSQLAQVTRSLSQSETSECRRLAGVLGIFLVSQAKALLRETSGQPCLLQFGADCTPLKLKSTTSKQVGAKRATISGHQTMELYVQQVFITTLDPQLVKKHCLVFREPVMLQHGKSMPALLASTLDRFPAVDLLTGLTNRVTLMHMVLDRAMSPSFRHALSGHWWDKISQNLEEPSSDGGEELLVWHTSVGCACHDAHNSLRWAHGCLYFEDQDLLKELYITIKVFKQAALSSTAVLVSWLTQVLEAAATFSPSGCRHSV